MARLKERTSPKGGTTWFVILPGLLVTDSLEEVAERLGGSATSQILVGVERAGRLVAVCVTRSHRAALKFCERAGSRGAPRQPPNKRQRRPV